MKHGFSFQGKDAKWSDIEEFYHHDSSKLVRLAPKLTQKHIVLPPFAALRVCLATQVISHSVAAGMSAMAVWGSLSSEASHTAEFLEMFDQLFNCFNSRTTASPAKMRHAMSNSSGHKDFLVSTKSWIKDLQCHGSWTVYITTYQLLLQSGISMLCMKILMLVIHIVFFYDLVNFLFAGTRRPACLRGWEQTINALLQLWEHLDQKQEGIQFLLTAQLNQDCLENLFSVIRLKGAARDNPDASQFRGAIRQVGNFFYMFSSEVG